MYYARGEEEKRTSRKIDGLVRNPCTELCPLHEARHIRDTGWKSKCKESNLLMSTHKSIDRIGEQVTLFENMEMQYAISVCDSAPVVERNPQLSSEAVSAFETKYEVALPIIYKEFLMNVGNGGFGGISPLTIEEDDPKRVNYYQNAKRRFPYESHVFMSDFQTFSESIKNSYESLREFVDIERARASYKAHYANTLEKQLCLFGMDEIYEGEAFKEWLYDDYLYSDHHFNGCIPITDEKDLFLVVNGKFSGKLFRDERANRKGAVPHVSKIRGWITFSYVIQEWVSDYLDDLMEQIPYIYYTD